jgi:type IV pilus assembly protein PilW
MSRKHQSGFTLIELLVALLIGLFLLGGMTLIVQDNKRAFVNQNGLAQLQDGERLAMTLMTDIIQTAGYYPAAVSGTSNTTSLISTASGLTAGQSIIGSSTGTSAGDTVTVQFATVSGDTILNCLGGSNTSGGALVYANQFYVQNNQLMCQLTAGATALPPSALVNNVTSLTINYGVNTNGVGVTGNNVNSYMTTAQVVANAACANVVSVQLTITFANPLAAVPGGGQGTENAITLTRTIDLMQRAGIG